MPIIDVCLFFYMITSRKDAFILFEFYDCSYLDQANKAIFIQ